jgi:hypothetical protein
MVTLEKLSIPKPTTRLPTSGDSWAKVGLTRLHGVRSEIVVLKFGICGEATILGSVAFAY